MGWRTAADGGGWGGEGVLAPTEYEWGIRQGAGAGELRENHVSVWDALVLVFLNRWDTLS